MTARTRASRVFGLATATYGISLLLRPRSLAAQLGIAEMAGEPAMRLVSAVIGVRDTADGLAIALAPKSSQRSLALLLRAAFDAADTAACLAFIPASRQRTRVAAFAAAWSALALAGAVATADR